MESTTRTCGISRGIMQLKSRKTPSALTYARQPREQHCDFCNEFSGELENSFAARYQSAPQSRVLLSTANFRVVPSLGQIVEGHLLIVPASHFTSIADVPPQI